LILPPFVTLTAGKTVFIVTWEVFLFNGKSLFGTTSLAGGFRYTKKSLKRDVSRIFVSFY